MIKLRINYLRDNGRSSGDAKQETRAIFNVGFRREARDYHL